MNRPIRIATRSSQLALWQAEFVAGLVQQADPAADVELVHVSTQGDRDQIESLRDFGGLGVFTREVQRAVLDGRADLAVHSLKDLPTQSTAGLVLAAVPRRAPVFDALVLPANTELRLTPETVLADLPMDWVVGTGSPRRQAQLRFHRPGWTLNEIRGNVGTRLRKLDAGDYDALILAEAGLQRLGLGERISLRLGPPHLLPAVSQGALGIECRDDDAELRGRLAAFSDAKTLAAVTAERSLLAELRAGCHAPLGAWSEFTGDESHMRLTAVVLNLEGTVRVSASATGTASDADGLGRALAARLQSLGAAELIEAGG